MVQKEGFLWRNLNFVNIQLQVTMRLRLRLCIRNVLDTALIHSDFSADLNSHTVNLEFLRILNGPEHHDLAAII